MAIAYQLRTFGDIVSAIRELVGVQSTDTTAINRIRREINIVYQEVAAKKNWKWLEGTTSVSIPAFISAGTVTATQNSADITFTVAPAASQAGRHFAVDGFSETYVIESHIANSTSAKLTEVYTGQTVSGATYKLWTDRFPLPTDCQETVEVWHDYHTQPMEGVGKQDYRRIVSAAPRAEGYPRVYYTGNFNDPRPTSSITSLPAVSSRSSAGTVKTLVFSGSIPSVVLTKISNGNPVRWRISGASHPSYNGDIFVSGVSTTTNPNDTITYTGRSELTESSTADASISVSQLDQEADYDRYMEMYVYPVLNTARVTLHADYVKEAVSLENDDDEPLIPYKDRDVLLFGALELVWDRMRNTEQSAKYAGKYQLKLAEMAGKLQDTFDTPKLQPSKRYLSRKRSPARRFGMVGDSFSPATGGTAGAPEVLGTANSVATFGTDGILIGSSNISTTELAALDNVDSNIQDQIDAITTLANGKIYVGDSGSNISEVMMSGDITMSNTGVTAIEPGVIVNADINASAAIAHTKLAGMAAGEVLLGNGSGVPTSTALSGDVAVNSSGVTAIQSGVIVNADVNNSAAIAYSKLNLSGSIVNADVSNSAAVAYSKLNLASSIVNADVNASAAIAYSKLNLASSIVNADISNSAAIARSKIATGSNYHVVTNDSGGALTSIAPGSAGTVLTSDGTQVSFTSLPSSSVKNYLINSNFRWWQRCFTSGNTIANGASTYGADCWYIKNSLGTNGVITFSKVAGGVDGSTYGGSVEITTAPTASQANGCELYQTLENLDSLELYNQTASFTVKVKALGNVNQVGAQFYYKTSEGKVDTSIGSEQTVSVSTGGYASLTISGQALGTSMTASGVVGVRIRITGVSSGNTYDLNNGFIVEQAMLNIGSSAGSWHLRAISPLAEFNLCERYYEKSYEPDTDPGTVTNAARRVIQGVGTATSYLFVPYNSLARVSGTVTYYNSNTGGTTTWYDPIGGSNRSISVIEETTRGTLISSSAFSSNAPITGHFTRDSSI